MGTQLRSPNTRDIFDPSRLQCAHIVCHCQLSLRSDADPVEERQQHREVVQDEEEATVPEDHTHTAVEPEFGEESCCWTRKKKITDLTEEFEGRNYKG